ncbi:MAG: hypothetical protein WCR42_07755 [bacterium]
MKRILALLLSVCITVILISCSDDTPTEPKVKTSFWKQTGKEIWWSYQIDSQYQSGSLSTWAKVASIPYGASFTVVRTGFDTKVYKLVGAEYNYTCLDSSVVMANKYSTTFSWDPLPVNMTADSLYTLGAETKGDGGNMLEISNVYKYANSTNDWVLLAYRNTGKTLAKVKIAKPTDVENPVKMAFKVNIASAYATIEYRYIYEWVTE